MCALAYHNAGPEFMPRSRAGLIAAIVDDYAQVMLSLDKTVQIESVEKAHEVLTRLGFFNLHKAGRSRPAFLAQLSAEKEGAVLLPDRTAEIEKAMKGLL
jgi:hypothetical protein